MKTYLIPLVPGPTRITSEVLAAYQTDFGSSDLEAEFYNLYQDSQKKIGKIIGTTNKITLMNGEAMIGLWAGLKSCLTPGDKVISVATGVYGYGIADMARSIGCEVDTVGFGYDEAANVNMVEEKIKSHHPKMVTIVHCETPSGTINPVAEIGELVRKYSIPLYYVDAVSSAGGMELKVDEWGIDICLVGSQKCLSATPDVSIISISERSWKIIDYIDYNGYDALAPWEDALENQWFPYTMSWHSIAALNKACKLILDEGLDNVFARHKESAEYCKRRISEMGLSLFPADEKFSSPTVTAIKIPPKVEWSILNSRLRKRGMVVGGSLLELAGKVFRIGHMGNQANLDLLEHGIDILEYILLYQ